MLSVSLYSISKAIGLTSVKFYDNILVIVALYQNLHF